MVLHLCGNYSIASKSLRKTDFSSPDWVFAKLDGHPAIVDPCNIKTTDLKKYNQTNIISHLFSTKAFEKLSKAKLPYHRAFKKNDFINDEGVKQVATKPNSYKFEKFIFDGFKYFDDLLLLEVEAEDEFAPIKAFTGTATPETALELYKKKYNL